MATGNGQVNTGELAVEFLKHASFSPGRSEYFNNLAQYKRNELIAKGRQIPPDGASSLNQSRSPRFSDRYKHRFGGSGQIVNPQQGEWFDQPKEPVPSM